MKMWPLKFRETPHGQLVFADDAGGYFTSSVDFLNRYATNDLSERDETFLFENGHAFEDEGDLSHTSFSCRWSKRQSSFSRMSYLILVPTLRCNLSCSYCQVSRAALNSAGYDWTPEILSEVLAFIDTLDGQDIKIEFQGGEPLLRLDLLKSVREFCRTRFTNAEFVICTNLQNLGTEEWEFLDAADTRVSTSLDGDRAIHGAQRTKSASATDVFFDNLSAAAKRLGPARVSALPTIDVDDPPDLGELIDLYESFGFASIYLRPVNHQGFARRKPQTDIVAWNNLHAKFIELLIERNFKTGRVVEEYYFSQCLKRVLRCGEESHVDLRNPNFLAQDYLVIDYDGRLFPTDEARMLYRIGHIDLSVGHVGTGVDSAVINTLNSSSFNNFDPECIHCPYQAFCGTDLVDDLSRYDRVDVPRNETWFCRRQTFIFDLVFELLYNGDDKTRYSLAKWAGLETLPPELAPLHL